MKTIINRFLAVAAIIFVAVLPLSSATHTWIQLITGTYAWDDPSNWDTGIVPNAIDDHVVLPVALGDVKIHLNDKAFTIGNITIDSVAGANYTINSGGADGKLIFDVSAGSININSTISDNSVINVPVVLSDDVIFFNPAGKLILASEITGSSPISITKLGNGKIGLGGQNNVPFISNIFINGGSITSDGNRNTTSSGAGRPYNYANLNLNGTILEAAVPVIHMNNPIDMFNGSRIGFAEGFQGTLGIQAPMSLHVNSTVTWGSNHAAGTDYARIILPSYAGAISGGGGTSHVVIEHKGLLVSKGANVNSWQGDSVDAWMFKQGIFEFSGDDQLGHLDNDITFYGQANGLGDSNGAVLRLERGGFYSIPLSREFIVDATHADAHATLVGSYFLGTGAISGIGSNGKHLTLVTGQGEKISIPGGKLNNFDTITLAGYMLIDGYSGDMIDDSSQFIMQGGFLDHFAKGDASVQEVLGNVHFGSGLNTINHQFPVGSTFPQLTVIDSITRDATRYASVRFGATDVITTGTAGPVRIEITNAPMLTNQLIGPWAVIDHNAAMLSPPHLDFATYDSTTDPMAPSVVPAAVAFGRFSDINMAGPTDSVLHYGPLAPLTADRTIYTLTSPFAMGPLDLNGHKLTVEGVIFDGEINNGQITANEALYIYNGNSTSLTTINAQITGNIPLVLNGLAFLDDTFAINNATNDYTGGTYLHNAILTIANPASISTGTLHFQNSELAVKSGMTINNDIQISEYSGRSGARFNIPDGHSLILNGHISGGIGSDISFGAINVIGDGGRLVLTNNNNNFTGDIYLENNTLSISLDSQLGSTFGGINKSIANSIFLSGTSTFEITNNVIFSEQRRVVMQGSPTIDTQANTLTITSSNQLQSDPKFPIGEIRKVGIGTLRSDSSNTLLHNDIRLVDGVMQARASNAFGENNLITMGGEKKDVVFDTTTEISGNNDVIVNNPILVPMDPIGQRTISTSDWNPEHPANVVFKGNIIIENNITIDIAPAPMTTPQVENTAQYRNGQMTVFDNQIIGFAGAGIIKEGAGYAKLTGSAPNTFDGATVVNDGVLEAEKNGSAANTSNILITNGTLLLSNTINMDRINDTAPVVMTGGKIQAQEPGIVETFETLTLSGNATIDFDKTSSGGSGTRFLFADSSATTWTSGAMLYVQNYRGYFWNIGDYTQVWNPGDDQLRFGDGTINTAVNRGMSLNSTDRINGQVSQIIFVNPIDQFGNLHPGFHGSVMLADGSIIPLPEPETYAAMLALLLLIAWQQRHKIRALIPRTSHRR